MGNRSEVNSWKLVIGVVVVSLLLVLAGCDNPTSSDTSSDDVGELVDYEGISEDIQEFVSQESLTVIENELEATVHRGDDPPTFNSEYKMSPVIFETGNVPDEFYFPGQQIADLYIRFSDQDTENNSLSVDFVEKNWFTDEVISVSEGIGSYIVGRDNSFSVFSVVEQNYEGDTVEGLYVFSGTLDEDGIADFQYTNFMLDNRGSDKVIPNDTGRLFYDGNEFTEAHAYPEDAEVESSASSLMNGLSID